MKDYSAGSLSIFYMACLCDLLYFNISYVVAAWFSDDTLSQSTEFFYYVTFGLYLSSHWLCFTDLVKY